MHPILFNILLMVCRKKRQKFVFVIFNLFVNLKVLKFYLFLFLVDS